MKKVLLLSCDVRSYAPSRIKEECKRRGLEYKGWEYRDLVFYLRNPYKITKNGTGDLLSFDYYILRGFHKNFYAYRYAVSEFLLFNNKTTLNKEAFYYFGGCVHNKLMQQLILIENNLPIVASTSGNNMEKNRNYPVIMKSFYGSHGSGVRKISSEKELKELSQEWRLEACLKQEFLPTREDYRVIVVGGRALGAMKRKAEGGNFLTNIGAGGSFENTELTSELKDLSLRSAKVFKADYCGVDIMYNKKGSPHILELNFAAEFEGFEACTGANVAGEIVDYLISKN